MAGAPDRRPRWAISLVALAGLPPSPLFVSELLILLGGVAGGRGRSSSRSPSVALALGFLGLLHALIEGVLGEPAKRRRPSRRSERRVVALTCALGGGLLALTAASCARCPGSALVEGLL